MGITSKVNSQKQSTLPSTYDLESPPWRACMGMLYKPNPFTMYDNQAISRYVLICNVNYKPLNLLGGWVVNFSFRSPFSFSLASCKIQRPVLQTFVNTGPPTPGIKANIALSSTKVRTLPNLLSISTLLPYTPLLPPFFPPRGQNTLFFGNVGSRRGRGFYTRTPPGTVLRSCGQPAGLRHFSKTIPEGVLDVDGTPGRRSYHS